MLSSAVFNDATYGLPIDTGTRVLYYNKKLFADAGLEPPTDWDQIPDLAKKLTDTSQGRLRLRGDLRRALAVALRTCGHVRAGERLPFVNDDATQCVLNQGDNVQAIQFWVDLFNEGVMSQDVLLTGTGRGARAVVRQQQGGDVPRRLLVSRHARERLQHDLPG